MYVCMFNSLKVYIALNKFRIILRIMEIFEKIISTYVTVVLNLSLVRLVYSWKLQLCLNGTMHETNSDRCKFGFWFTEPLVVHKICFEHGVWAIYQEFCEESPVIWTVRPGTKGCIRHDELGKRIKGVVPIGQDERSGAVVSTSKRRLFFNNHNLKHGMRLSFLNTPADIEVLTWGPPQTKYSLHQYINKGKGILQQCLIKGQHSFFGYYRIRLEQPTNASLFLAKNVCYSPLSRQTGEGGRRVQLLPTEIDFDILQSTSDEADENMNCEQFIEVDEEFQKDLNDITGLLARSDDDNDKLASRSSVQIAEKRVDEETQKITLKLLGYHFRNDTFDQNYGEWEFLNVAKQIFLYACPEAMVPPFFVDQMHLLFQAVLHESFLHFPNHVDKDKGTSQRILHALQTCLQNASALEFKTGENCTDDAPLLKKTYKNGTAFYMLVEMPSFIKVDGVNFDLLMESIWKLMNFAHYYCSESFSEFATDHSLLEGHWYRLFSPLIIRRWKYPGHGYRIFQQIFMSIDMDKSVRNLDFCVSAARLHSSYKGWLKRPLTHWQKEKQLDVPLQGRNGNKESMLVWDDQAYCMKDYMDPAFKLGDSIEKCGIRLPLERPMPQVFFYKNGRGTLIS